MGGMSCSRVHDRLQRPHCTMVRMLAASRMVGGHLVKRCSLAQAQWGVHL
jgi:hypothetical protein